MNIHPKGSEPSNLGTSSFTRGGCEEGKDDGIWGEEVGEESRDLEVERVVIRVSNLGVMFWRHLLRLIWCVVSLAMASSNLSEEDFE